MTKSLRPPGASTPAKSILAAPRRLEETRVRCGEISPPSSTHDRTRHTHPTTRDITGDEVRDLSKQFGSTSALPTC
jgi:hypothetical protein